MPLMISVTGWVLLIVLLLVFAFAWFLAQRHLRAVIAGADALRFDNAALEASRAKLSRELAERVRSGIQQGQYDEYTAFVPKMQALSAFMNREFPADMKRAQLHRPPLHVFEVVQNLLVENRGKVSAA